VPDEGKREHLLFERRAARDTLSDARAAKIGYLLVMIAHFNFCP
jgi:hypothetical protein